MVPSEVVQSPDTTTGRSPRLAAAATSRPTAEYSAVSRPQVSSSGRSAVTIWSGWGARSSPGRYSSR